MDLNNEFEVDAPVDRAWATLTDVEKIAPCLPGAQLQEIEGDEYRGAVKVKVGPITAQYKGAASFLEQDDENHTAKLKADGRDTRGAGNASAIITAKAVAIDENRTKVTVDTDLSVTGKVAQFGRGVMADVSAKLMKQFADNLGELLEAENAAGAAESSDDAAASAEPEADEAAEVQPVAEAASSNGASAAAPSEVRKINMPEPEAVDLMETAGAPVAKRLGPLLGLLVAFFILRRFRGGRG